MGVRSENSNFKQHERRKEYLKTIYANAHKQPLITADFK